MVRQCPECRSYRVKPRRPEGFAILSNCECKDCHALWTPPVPASLGIIAIVAGVPLGLLGGVLVLSTVLGASGGSVGIGLAQAVWLGVALLFILGGFGMAIRGLAVLKGQNDRARVLRSGYQATATDGDWPRIQ